MTQISFTMSHELRPSCPSPLPLSVSFSGSMTTPPPHPLHPDTAPFPNVTILCKNLRCNAMSIHHSNIGRNWPKYMERLVVCDRGKECLCPNRFQIKFVLIALYAYRYLIAYLFLSGMLVGGNEPCAQINLIFVVSLSITRAW